jgi:hypothetical protein
MERIGRGIFRRSSQNARIPLRPLPLLGEELPGLVRREDSFDTKETVSESSP